MSRKLISTGLWQDAKELPASLSSTHPRDPPVTQRAGDLAERAGCSPNRRYGQRRVLVRGQRRSGSRRSPRKISTEVTCIPAGLLAGVPLHGGTGTRRWRSRRPASCGTSERPPKLLGAPSRLVSSPLMLNPSSVALRAHVSWRPSTTSGRSPTPRPTSVQPWSLSTSSDSWSATRRFEAPSDPSRS